MTMDETPRKKYKQKPATTVCPQGHIIGSRPTGAGRRKCKANLCALTNVEELKAVPVDLDLDALAAIPEQDKPFAARSALAKLPDGLKGEEALKWSQEKLVELLPEAVANVTWNLRYGTDKQRDEATDRVLKANGLDKKDANATVGQNYIVLQMGAQDNSIPWLARSKNAQQLTDVVSSKPVTPSEEE